MFILVICLGVLTFFGCLESSKRIETEKKKKELYEIAIKSFEFDYSEAKRRHDFVKSIVDLDLEDF